MYLFKALSLHLPVRTEDDSEKLNLMEGQSNLVCYKIRSVDSHILWNV